MDRKQIGLLRFILESYEGIATLTTLDSAEGRVLLRVPPGCETEVDDLLEDLADSIRLEPDTLHAY